ncbi:MAG: energy transducer TonB [Flavobacteriales bacterium]
MKYIKVILFLLIPFNYSAQEVDSLSTDSILTKAERMPVFPGCKLIEDPLEQAKCSESKILQYIAENTVYPAAARYKGIEGRVFVTFVVNTEGYVEDIELIKSVHPLLDEAAINATSALLRMEPAYQDGKKVKLMYTLPVNFKLRSAKSIRKARKEQRNASN